MVKTIVICSSGAFYEHANRVAEELEKLGYKAVVPATARQMKISGDYDIAKVKTWYQDPSQAPIKVAKMRGHFEEVNATLYYSLMTISLASRATSAPMALWSGA